MFEPKLIINEGKYNELYKNMASTEFEKFAEVLILVNPFYNWLEENINNISYKLLKGFISNIVPLGDAGRHYFERIIDEKGGFSNELMSLYNKLEGMYTVGNIRVKSYLELQNMGYTGELLGEKYPVDDIIKYFKQQQ